MRQWPNDHARRQQVGDPKELHSYCRGVPWIFLSALHTFLREGTKQVPRVVLLILVSAWFPGFTVPFEVSRVQQRRS